MAQTHNLILRIVTQRGEIGSAELMKVLEKFGRSPDAARAALNRMTQAEILTNTGQGRGDQRYRVGPQGQLLVGQFIAKLARYHLALTGRLAWDSNWLVVTFSVPERQRVKRDTLRARLTELGFGLLSASVWTSPFDQEAEVTALIEQLDLAGQVTLLRCQRIWQPGQPADANLAYQVWDLGALEHHYQDFNHHAEELMAALEQARQGKEIDVEAVFFGTMELQGELIEIILNEDPCLPAVLLPPDWPGQRIHELIHALTSAISRLDLAGSRYEYLFHLIKGMELTWDLIPEGDVSWHWPSEDEVAP